MRRHAFHCAFNVATVTKIYKPGDLLKVLHYCLFLPNQED